MRDDLLKAELRWQKRRLFKRRSVGNGWALWLLLIVAVVLSVAVYVFDLPMDIVSSGE